LLFDGDVERLRVFSEAMPKGRWLPRGEGERGFAPATLAKPAVWTSFRAELKKALAAGVPSSKIAWASAKRAEIAAD
jgi:hypothetical protein